MFSDKEDDIFTNTVSNENKTLADRQSVTYGIAIYRDFPTLVNVSRKVNSYIWHC